MSDTTKIEWCDHTWSPWQGCTKVGPGCDHCYAEARDQRFHKGSHWGAGAERHRTVDWTKPRLWNRAAARDGVRRSVFPSLCDPFDNEVNPQWRDDLWALIRATPNLDWLLLTKRIGNAARMLPCSPDSLYVAYPNVRIGATIVNQEELERDVRKLAAIRAAVRFISYEPALGPLDFTGLIATDMMNDGTNALHEIDWLIVGGESGRDARPLHLDWVRSIVEQCQAVGTAVLVKQLGHEVLDSGSSSPGEHWPMGTVRRPIPYFTDTDPPFMVRLLNAKGADMNEWPEDLRVREFPLIDARQQECIA